MTSTSQRVLIRADAGHGTGYGHLVRCVTIATYLARQSVEVTFAICDPPADVVDRVVNAGARVHTLPRTPAGARRVLSADAQRRDAHAALAAHSGADGAPWDAVIVDHYGLDIAWEREARRSAKVLVAIDDLADRPHDVDVLVDHNWYGDGTAERYRALVPPHTLQLLGPRYCLLDAAYALHRATRDQVHRPPRTVLVNFGGTDAGDQTMVATAAALQHTDLRVEIAVGSPAAVSAELAALADTEDRVTLHVALPNLASLLGRVDLVVGASGTGTWERMCMGVPAIVTTVSEQQSGVTRALAQEHACVWLGVAAHVGADDYANALVGALSGDEIEPLAVVDGFGSARVAQCILGARVEDAVRRPATDQDDASVVSLSASFEPDAGPERWRELRAEFERLRAGGSRVDILCVDEIPIGVELRWGSGDITRLTDASLDGRRT